MSNKDIWSAIHVERQALAVDLASLSEAQWETASGCADWTVRDVVAHMTAAAAMNPPTFVGRWASNGFSFSKLQVAGIARERGSSSADTLTRFRSILTSTSHPPGPTPSWLGETLVHAEDVRRPLGIKHEYPTASAVVVANFYKGSNLLIGSKGRIAGLRLSATDTEWVSGDGPAVEGPILSLVLAMTGRKSAIPELEGDGSATLAARA